jgi:hypothetical protein
MTFRYTQHDIFHYTQHDNGGFVFPLVKLNEVKLLVYVAGRREDRMLRFARYNERQDASLRSA